MAEEQDLELTRIIARFIFETDISDIPSKVFEHAKVAFLDWFAVTMAGRNEPLVLKLIRFADLMGGYEQATILGHGMKKNISIATLINGSASHALDYDDTMRVFMGHPSVVLFPSLLAFSEWKEKSGVDFLMAYVIGLKVGACIGACAGLEHYLAGWHATSTIGRLASVAGCAKLMKLHGQQIVYALGIAGTQASGSKRVFGTMCKPFHAGRASQVGLEAALLAGEGFTSAEDILEGPSAFFELMKGQVKREAVDSLGKTWEIEDLAQKYHASCFFTHSPIEALLAILNKERLLSNDIKSIKVSLSQMAMDAAGKVEPLTGLEGKFSLSYCLANALLRGNTGMQAFTNDKVKDPEVKEFMEKISFVPNPEMINAEARVEVETNSGNVYSGFYDAYMEIPELKIKKAKVKNKYIDLCGSVLGDRKTKDLMELILSLEELDNMKRFIEEI